MENIPEGGSRQPAAGHQPTLPAQGFAACVDTGVFCQAGCSELLNAHRQPRLFDSAPEAIAAGFRPCRQCRPLQAGSTDPDWLPDLLGTVNGDPARRWHDQDLAELGLDPAAIRDWFTANQGLTFHGYCRLLRLGQALRRMQQGIPAGQAVRDTGYESESDFREAFALVFGDPPNAVDRESCVWINRARTPLGSMIMGVADSGLYLLEFAEHRRLDARLQPLRREFGRVFLPGDHTLALQVQEQLDAYFEGRLRQFTLPVKASGTDFQERVWLALREIPYGQMRSYADIAHRVGHPDAVRAVGRANGDNRIAIVIPCHRVVGSNGELVGYGGGLWRQRFLLALEQSESFSLS